MGRVNSNGADTALKVQKLLKNMIECMSQETMALKAHNHQHASKMGEEKVILMQSYKAIFAELNDNPDLLRSTDEDVHKELKRLAGDFETALKDNIIAIQVGRGAVNRLIERLMGKAREAINQSGRNYDAKGKFVERQARGSFTPSQLNEIY